MKVLAREDLNHEPDIEWLWDGILPTHSIVTLAARGGLGKSALMTGLSIAMMNGLDYLGRSVRRGTVLYVVLEGFSGMKARLRAWEIHLGVEVDSTDVAMTRTLDMGELRTLQSEHQYDLVIVDTASKTGLIENENSNPDVATFLAAFEMAVHDGNPAATGVIIHHVTESVDGHGGRSYKARGASAWRDNVDTMVLMTGTKSSVILSTDHPFGKQRDGASITVRGLAVVPFDDGVVVVVVDKEPEEAHEEEMMKERTQTERQERDATTDLNTLRRHFKGRKPSRDDAKKALGAGSDRAARALALWP